MFHECIIWQLSAAKILDLFVFYKYQTNQNVLNLDSIRFLQLTSTTDADFCSRTMLQSCT